MVDCSAECSAVSSVAGRAAPSASNWAELRAGPRADCLVAMTAVWWGDSTAAMTVSRLVGPRVAWKDVHWAEMRAEMRADSRAGRWDDWWVGLRAA